ncbi:unnamed protein product [Staurois parvus]|uniref:Uncharacterized protein n=1 Tax=Staurois parvus TaxID=386267 RepID=A0ABN9H671_9NEOB|nr:unnamed protein product [Staurois parvus]
MRYSGPGSSMRRAVRGPMADYEPGSSNGRPCNLPAQPIRQNGTHQQCEET